jgi:hypothetical protein
VVEAVMVAVTEREGGGSASSPSPGGEELSRREENERENREEWGMREVRTGMLHEGDNAGVGGAAPLDFDFSPLGIDCLKPAATKN